MNLKDDGFNIQNNITKFQKVPNPSYTIWTVKLISKVVNHNVIRFCSVTDGDQL